MLKEPPAREPEAREPDPAPADIAAPRIGRRGRAGVVTAIIALAALAIGVYHGISGRVTAEASLATTTAETAVPIVDVVHPQAGAPDQELTLPGQTVAFTDTPIYARTSGYLTHWYFDIGAHVRKGQLLAQIETPELDAQLRQARADLETAQANTKLAGITADRTANLLRTQSVSTQARDNAAGAYAADQAIVASRQAEVARLEELQSYENVYAPFDGAITQRNTDVGDLINAGAGTPNTQLFHMMATGTLRIYVAVPEDDAPAIHIGATPTVTLDEFPGQVFRGTLVRTADAIDPQSRTLLVEVDVDNAAGKLLPGAYALVHFELSDRVHSVTIPSNAMLFRSEGLRVGVVRNGVAQLVPITIGRDYGGSVEVLTGLQQGDQVIVNPSDALISGTAVRIAGGRPEGAT
ncbi:MAG TPA: efflux RND transporter periplasmic adaptor subunit [Acetobacteraceae bacterium]|jgi:RND family efflux transporter MFP subunit|nr:efflux RND transporter periplasmic adaptor subunit [Acetobacteraceae bacterium]